MEAFKRIFFNLVLAIMLSILSIYIIERLFSLMTSDLILSCLKTLRTHIDLKNDTAKNIYLIVSRVAISIDTLMVTLFVGLFSAKSVKRYGLGYCFWSLYLIIYAIPLFLSLFNAINTDSTFNVLGIVMVLVLMVITLVIGLKLNKYLVDIFDKLSSRV